MKILWDYYFADWRLFEVCGKSIVLTFDRFVLFCLIIVHSSRIHIKNILDIKTGAPNENIVQNHLKIALLNVFSRYLNGRYRHIFIP